MSEQMTFAQWWAVHPDHRTHFDGRHWVSRWVDGRGTCLIPVEIIA